MKKITKLLIIIITVLSIKNSIYADKMSLIKPKNKKYSQAIEYTILKHPLKIFKPNILYTFENNRYTIIEFFSFYCSYCYNFEHTYKIFDKTLKKIPRKIKITKFHINFVGKMGQELTQAWSVAIFLGIEDKINPLFFNAVQKNNYINSIDDIQKIFAQVGIKQNIFKIIWNSPIVKQITIQQEKSAKEIVLKEIPTILINKRFILKNDELNKKYIDDYIEQLSKLIILLLNK